MRLTELRTSILKAIAANRQPKTITELAHLVERPNNKTTWNSGIHRCVRGLLKGGAIVEDESGRLLLTDLGRDLIEQSEFVEPEPVFFVPVRNRKNTK